VFEVAPGVVLPFGVIGVISKAKRKKRKKLTTSHHHVAEHLRRCCEYRCLSSASQHYEESDHSATKAPNVEYRYRIDQLSRVKKNPAAIMSLLESSSSV
jgi:hypothetical protein